MRILVAGLPISQDTTFDLEKQYSGELDDKLKELENTIKDFEKKYNLILKYNAEGCDKELGCIIFMEDVNLTLT